METFDLLRAFLYMVNKDISIFLEQALLWALLPYIILTVLLPNAACNAAISQIFN